MRLFYKDADYEAFVFREDARNLPDADLLVLPHAESLTPLVMARKRR